MDSYLRMQDISKSFPGVQALDRVHMEVQPGEVHALLGENGAGKSTLMKILSGVYQPDSGEILIEGRSVQFSDTRAAEQAGIAIIHQELNLIPQMTVAENIYLGREPRTKFGLVDYKTMRQAAETELQQLEVRIPVHARIADLRVGEQQLVEIAKALSLHAKVVIMDEPTSALSETEVEKLFKVIRWLQQNGVAIIYISHKLEEIFAIADKVTVLRDGKYIGTCVVKESTAQQLVGMMVGRELADLFPKEKARLGEELLRVQGLTVRHPSQSHRNLLEEIHLSLRSGEILGIAGLMGSGRTELLMTLFGACPGQRVAGKLFVRSRPVELHSPQEAIQYGLALVTEDRKAQGLFLQLPVQWNISIAALRQVVKRWVLRHKLEKAMAQRYIDQLRIKIPSLAGAVETLSGGNQQKVILAKWMATAPSILLLDDPTRGVDVGAKAEIYHLMNQFAEQGIGVIMVSSELPEILAMSDRILVLSEGRIVAEFSREEASEEKIMTAATRTKAA
ncbi:sugar ABC transporter ATP-binding protein [bacterium]|nr:sugar ABC transporter ATP-binding protein [bacterium]